MFGECHVPVHVKDLFSRHIVAAIEDYICRHYPILHTFIFFVPTHFAILLYFSSLPNSLYFFSGSRKSLAPLTHPFQHFYIVLYIYIIEFVLVINRAEILLSGCQAMHNQSIYLYHRENIWLPLNCIHLLDTYCMNVKYVNRINFENRTSCINNLSGKHFLLDFHWKKKKKK